MTNIAETGLDAGVCRTKRPICVCLRFDQRPRRPWFAIGYAVAASLSFFHWSMESARRTIADGHGERLCFMLYVSINREDENEMYCHQIRHFTRSLRWKCCSVLPEQSSDRFCRRKVRIVADIVPIVLNMNEASLSDTSTKQSPSDRLSVEQEVDRRIRVYIILDTMFLLRVILSSDETASTRRTSFSRRDFSQWIRISICVKADIRLL